LREVGVVLRLTGTLPFAERSTTQATKRHANGDAREDFTLHLSMSFELHY